MEDLLEQIEFAANSNAHYLALFSALTLPDICAALESEDGETSGAKYKAWFDRWMAHKFESGGKILFSGADCYYYRCGMLHQGRSQHPKMQWKRVIFFEPGHGMMGHMNRTATELNLDAGFFARLMVASVEQWLDANEGNVRVQANLQSMMRRHPNGWPGVTSTPIIA